MTNLIMVTNARGNSAEILPALSLLNHQVKIMPAEPSALINAPICDAVLVDARKDLPGAKSLCRLIRTTGITAPLIAITTEGGLIAITPDWGLDEIILETSGPAEVDARIRLVIARVNGVSDSEIIAVVKHVFFAFMPYNAWISLHLAIKSVRRDINS